jgi:hypothetical protein
METAVHLRNAEQASDLARLPEQFSRFCETASPSGAEMGEEIARSFTRIYVGDEFCPHRMPRPAELDALLDLACESAKNVTLLTPPLTDAGIDECAQIFDRVGERCPEAEVVANDWGVLLFLKEKYPEFRIATGRLLDKGFKDPRLTDADAFFSHSEEMAAVLNTSSFDSPALREKLIELGVVRTERDMFPYRACAPEPSPGLETSIYLPFGYVATGRVCWTSTFSGDGKFALLDDCARPCDRITMKLEHEDALLPLIQSGGTVHYLHSPAALESIFEAAESGNIRLVYQGLAL